MLSALENHKCFKGLLQRLPLRVGARQVAAQRAERAFAGIEDEGDRVGQQPGLAARNQQPERMRGDECLLGRDVGLAKGWGLVHLKCLENAA